MKILPAILLATLTSGCATKEYWAARNICAAKYEAEIPKEFIDIAVDTLRPVEVPDGTVSCTSHGFGYQTTTRCTPGTRLEYVPHTVIRSVDINASRRAAAIRDCTASSCTQQYGNAECALSE